MNRKSIYFKLVTALACATFLYGCSPKSTTGTNTTTNQVTQTAQTATTTEVKGSIIGDKAVKSVISELVTYDKEDSYSDWKNENPNYIELTGTTASAKGLGVEVKNGKVTIAAAGTYVISGKLDNGQIIRMESLVRMI